MPRARDERSASVIVLRPVLAELERDGGNVAPILCAIGLERHELTGYERRVPESARRQVWRMAAAASGNPFFGLQVARHARLGTYDVVDYAAHWSRNLEDALARLVRFHRLLSDATELSVEVHRGWTTFRRGSRASAVDAQECDSFFATLTLRARAMVGRSLRARHVRFSHAPPASLRATYSGCGRNSRPAPTRSPSPAATC